MSSIPTISTIGSVGPKIKESGSWVTDYAWISGVAGALTVLILALVFNRTNTLQTGIYFFGHQLTDNRTDTVLGALFIISAVMLTVELVRLWFWDKSNFICIDPAIKNGKYADFLGKCVANYLLYLLAFFIVMKFFHTAGEYGYKNGAAYYQAWFRLFDILFNAYLWAGLPYVIFTRALKYDKQADGLDTAWFLSRLLMWPIAKLVGVQKLVQLGDRDSKAIRGLIVKIFFTPLMTGFFIGQFPHLVSNVGYLLDTLPSTIVSGNYSHRTFNSDFFNISIAVIFSIDVALAWCGYVVNSRWVDNQTVSAEPTMLGWVVCLICYPPFQRELGLYYSAPAEREILHLIPEQWVVTILTVMMVASYIVYMCATLWFGVRFSNLTNRGIIRKGPFAFIRHPAYASKNFSWWCVMFPPVIYHITHSGFEQAALSFLGLVLMTWVYWWRAITEERHLMADPMYQEYCKQVKYRFIPGVY
ncbi:hypothetical protein SAMN02745866_02749 [Alteromonadaceae bacterium Bs31]|nr:hypothetical protein SAMN02745866_02749 [Alteromonadaceae bacterium Bs31]